MSNLCVLFVYLMPKAMPTITMYVYIGAKSVIVCFVCLFCVNSNASKTLYVYIGAKRVIVCFVCLFNANSNASYNYVCIYWC